MSLRSHSALSRIEDSAAAGRALGQEIRDALGDADAIIVFASSQHDYGRLLAALQESSGCSTLVGSSSAGEFNNSGRGTGWASAMAISSPSMKFSLGIGRDIGRDPEQAAKDMIAGFAGMGDRPMPHRCALVMTDALAGHTDQLLEHLTVATRGSYNFVGGGAGDDGHFSRTHVFAGTQALTDAAVALEIQSTQPVGIGVAHGWTPAGPPLRVTEAEGTRLIGLNGAPAASAFEDHAEASGQKIDRDNSLPFLLHNVLGIQNGDGYRLRVPLSLNADGSVSCAAAVPAGSIVHIMKTSAESAVEAASTAARSAIDALAGRKPKAALVFDCVATRLRLGDAFQDELDACADILKPASFTGCNTYGQIARAAGQFGGFHNCTAVVCVFAE